jgi:hypothetical protein
MGAPAGYFWISLDSSLEVYLANVHYLSKLVEGSRVKLKLVHSNYCPFHRKLHGCTEEKKSSCGQLVESIETEAA